MRDKIRFIVYPFLFVILSQMYKSRVGLAMVISGFPCLKHHYLLPRTSLVNLPLPNKPWEWRLLQYFCSLLKLSVPSAFNSRIDRGFIALRRIAGSNPIMSSRIYRWPILTTAVSKPISLVPTTTERLEIAI